MDASPFTDAENEDSDDGARWYGSVHGHGLRPSVVVVASSFRGGIAGRAIVIGFGPDRATAIARAKVSLTDACGDLDAAVMTRTTVDGETVMADAALVALLLRVARARRELRDLELPR